MIEKKKVRIEKKEQDNNDENPVYTDTYYSEDEYSDEEMMTEEDEPTGTRQGWLTNAQVAQLITNGDHDDPNNKSLSTNTEPEDIYSYNEQDKGSHSENPHRHPTLHFMMSTAHLQMVNKIVREAFVKI